MKPSMQPAVNYPSALPSEQPLMCPTHPSSQPTVHPSSTNYSSFRRAKPSAIPTPRPSSPVRGAPINFTTFNSSSPTGALTEYLEFEITLMLVNLSSPNLDSVHRQAFIDTVSAMMNVSSSAVVVQQSSSLTRRRKLLESFQLEQSTTTTVMLSKYPGYRGDTAGLASTLFYSLQVGVYSGSATTHFRRLLAARAVHEATLPMIVDVVIAGTTSGPTLPPTPTWPGAPPTASRSTSSLYLTVGIVAGLFFLVCVAGPLAYMIRSASINKQKEAKRSSDSIDAEGGSSSSPSKPCVNHHSGQPFAIDGSDDANMDPTKICSIILVQNDFFDQEDLNGLSYSDYQQMYNTKQGINSSITYSSSLSMDSNAHTTAALYSLAELPPSSQNYHHHNHPHIPKTVVEVDSSTVNMTDIYPPDNHKSDAKYAKSGAQTLAHWKKSSRGRESQRMGPKSLEIHSGDGGGGGGGGSCDQSEEEESESKSTTECRKFVPEYVSTIHNRFLHVNSKQSSLSFSRSDDNGVCCSGLIPDDQSLCVSSEGSRDSLSLDNKSSASEHDSKVESNVYNGCNLNRSRYYSSMDSIESDNITFLVG